MNILCDYTFFFSGTFLQWDIGGCTWIYSECDLDEIYEFSCQPGSDVCIHTKDYTGCQVDCYRNTHLWTYIFHGVCGGIFVQSCTTITPHLPYCSTHSTCWTYTHPGIEPCAVCLPGYAAPYCVEGKALQL